MRRIDNKNFGLTSSRQCHFDPSPQLQWMIFLLLYRQFGSECGTECHLNPIRSTICGCCFLVLSALPQFCCTCGIEFQFWICGDWLFALTMQGQEIGMDNIPPNQPTPIFSNVNIQADLSVIGITSSKIFFHERLSVLMDTNDCNQLFLHSHDARCDQKLCCAFTGVFTSFFSLEDMLRNRVCIHICFLPAFICLSDQLVAFSLVPSINDIHCCRPYYYSWCTQIRCMTCNL